MHYRDDRCPVPPSYVYLRVSLTGLVHLGGTGHREIRYVRTYCAPLTVRTGTTSTTVSLSDYRGCVGAIHRVLSPRPSAALTQSDDESWRSRRVYVHCCTFAVIVVRTCTKYWEPHRGSKLLRAVVNIHCGVS